MYKDNEKFKLVIPTEKYKKQAIKYIREHNKYKSQIVGCGGLYNYLDNYSGWLDRLARERFIDVSEFEVPNETYFLIRVNDDKIVGMVNIRKKLNNRARNSYGNIGYGIRPTERRKGYNKINLYLALCECKKFGIENVIISCEKDNIASSKTMKALGAYFDKEIYNSTENKIVEMYRIDVDFALRMYKNEYEKYICNE